MVIIGNFITEELIFGNRLSSTKIMMISDLLPNKEPTKFPSKSDALKRLGGQLYGIIYTIYDFENVYGVYKLYII